MIGTIFAVPASLAASSGAGSIPPPMITAGAVAANRAVISSGRGLNASLMVICRSSAAVGPGADSPSSCTTVSSVSDSCSATT